MKDIKISIEEFYHLVDLLEMNIKHTPNKTLLNDSQKKEAINYDKNLIEKLESILDEKL